MVNRWHPRTRSGSIMVLATTAGILAPGPDLSWFWRQPRGIPRQDSGSGNGEIDSMKIGNVVIPALAGLLSSLALLSAADTRLVWSFENPAEIQKIKTTNSRVTRVQQHATDGRYAAQVDFEAADQPKIELSPDAKDFRPFASLALDVLNPSQEPLSFAMEVEDASGAKTVAHTALPLGAGEAASFVLTLNSPPPLQMGMREIGRA